MASFADGVLSESTFIVRLNYIQYDGSTGFNKNLSIAGMTAGAKAVSDVYGITALWTPEWGLGGTWSYSMSATIPWVEMDVEADIMATLGSSATVRRSDQESGLGDVVLMPSMLNQKINNDLNANYRLAIYAPTGEYEVGQLANTGKNYWTIEPTAAIMYFGQQNGIEASIFFGMDFNSEYS